MDGPRRRRHSTRPDVAHADTIYLPARPFPRVETKQKLPKKYTIHDYNCSPMSTKKRRSHPDAADNSYADCPFNVRIFDSSDKRRRPPKRPRTGGAHNNDGFDKKQRQSSPFAPKGEFQGQMTMDVCYVVEPARKWIDMKRYKSFICKSGAICRPLPSALISTANGFDMVK